MNKNNKITISKVLENLKSFFKKTINIFSHKDPKNLLDSKQSSNENSEEIMDNYDTLEETQFTNNNFVKVNNILNTKNNFEFSKHEISKDEIFKNYIETNNMKKIKEFFKSNDINEFFNYYTSDTFKYECSYLYYALLCKDVSPEMIQLLQNLGAKSNDIIKVYTKNSPSNEYYGNYSIFGAYITKDYCNFDIAKKLLNAEADIDISTTNKNNIITSSTLLDSPNINTMKFLLQNGANIDKKISKSIFPMDAKLNTFCTPLFSLLHMLSFPIGVPEVPFSSFHKDILTKLTTQKICNFINLGADINKGYTAYDNKGQLIKEISFKDAFLSNDYNNKRFFTSEQVDKISKTLNEHLEIKNEHEHKDEDVR